MNNIIKTIPVNQIVNTISETHTFNADHLFAVNTSDVHNGAMLTPPYLPVCELKGQFKKTIQNEDILFSEIRPANKHFAVVNVTEPEKYVASTKLMVLRKFNDDVDLDYFYYWLTNTPFLNVLQRRAENRICSFPQITFELLSEYNVPVPELSTQKKIAEMLRIVDSKIENNNSVSSTLKSLAKTIYDYWFVQFDFPDENGRPYKSSGGKMVWNEELKKEIPEGWKVKRLDSIEKTIITGKTPSTEDKDNYGQDIPFVTIGDIRGNTYVTTTAQCLSRKGAESQAAKMLPEGSLCVTCIATPGLLGFTTCESQTNQQINSIVFENTYNKYFLYFSIMRYFAISAGAKTGNTFANMNKEEFSSIKVIYSESAVKSFHNSVSSLFEQIKLVSLESTRLASLRDFLLPMLMNGQVKVVS